jgi:hypothetical protein
MKLWSLLSLAMGLATGMLGAFAIAACCPEAKDVVWDVSPGSYSVDERFGPQPLHGDANYQLVVAADGNSATESYQRGGKLFLTEYAIGPGSESPLRTNTSLGDE